MVEAMLVLLEDHIIRLIRARAPYQPVDPVRSAWRMVQAVRLVHGLGVLLVSRLWYAGIA